MKRRIFSHFLILLAGYCFAADAPPASESDFKTIFNGKDLTGWQGDPVVWSVKDGAIHSKVMGDPGGKAQSSILAWNEGNVDDFELRFSCRFVDRSPAAAGNLNVKYRVADNPDGTGYWFVLDMHDTALEKGRLLEVKGRKLFSKLGKQTVARNGAGDRVDVLDLPGNGQTSLPPYHADDWNEVTVIAEGNHLVHKLNGVVTTDFIDEDVARRRSSGLLALRLWIPRGPAIEAEFKNIRLRRIQNAKIISAQVAPGSKPLPASDKGSATERLKKLKSLLEQGLITKEDYDKKVKEIMDTL